MKKIVLSTVALATMATMANASDATELAALKKQMAAMMKKMEMLEKKQATSDKKVEEINVAKGTTIINSKVPVIELSGQHYIHAIHDTHSNVAGNHSTNNFNTSRNYFQLKGFFADNPKDYFRITMDTKQSDAVDGGSFVVRAKYAYLYLDEILPYTGVEIGLAHTPWLDYEEHHGWWYRSLGETVSENGNSGHLWNSSDLGVNFKTKTDYFSSELGLFNGAGYHGIDNTTGTPETSGISGEWRLTAHLLGTGKAKEKIDETFANVSFFGMENTNTKTNLDLNWYGFHAVYNQPEFLLAAQYIKVRDALNSATTTDHAWSINGEYRFMDKYALLARHDKTTMTSAEAYASKTLDIAGISYDYNKNVQFVASYQGTKLDNAPRDNAFMLTTEINW